MIFIYPMLVSRAVSENIVPGLSKTLENYICANAKDLIITDPQIKHSYNFKIKGKSLFLKEGFDDEFDRSTRTKPLSQQGMDQAKKDQYDYEEKKKEEFRKEKELQIKIDKYNDDKKERELKRIKDEKAEEKEKEKEAKELAAKRARADVKIQDSKALSVEPSFIEIDAVDRNGYPVKRSLGVKVIAVRVKSDVKLSRLIVHDTQLSNFNALMIGIGRKITRNVWGFVDRWTRRGNLTPSGDPRRDIIMARTGHQGEGFVVLSKTDDIDEEFLSNIPKLNRLFKMGWGNLIIVDDVNRMAYFCMKKFKGICTAISFSMIYQNFGALTVYKDLEDAKRQSSSIFKIRKPLSKIVAEWVTEYRQVKYLSEDKYDGFNE